MIAIESFTKETFVSSKNTELNYRFYNPDCGNDRPLLIFLHGAGERGNDNEVTLNSVSPFAQDHAVDFEKYRSYIIAPQCRNDHRWVETDWGKGSYDFDSVEISSGLSAVKELIDTVVEKYNIDKNRIYITGCSMGGYGTWYMLTKFPGFFKAAIPICGAGDPSKAHLLKSTPIWTFHGDADNSVPVQGSRDMVCALRRADADIIYSEYPGVGHGVWWQAYQSKAIFDWLFSR